MAIQNPFKHLCLFVFLFATTLCFANEKVYVLKVQSDIDIPMGKYIELGLKEAKRDTATLVVLHMNTYGGRVDVADDIVDRIQKYEGTVVVFIDTKAASAGSYISIACDSIYMTTGSTIGASTVVNQTGEVVPEKYQSHMRSRMRAVAQSHGRDTIVNAEGDTIIEWRRRPDIAEGFVGLALSTDSARVISLTTDEAIEEHFCEGRFASIDEVLAYHGKQEAKVVEFQFDTENKIAAFFLSPFVKSILIMMILGGIYMEMKTPGIGFPIGVAFLGLLGYFIPDYLHGLLEVWELLIFIVGIALILLEVFVIPGFGVAGVSGIVLVIVSLVFSMVGNVGFDFTPVPTSALESAYAVMGVSIFGGALFVVFGGMMIVKSKRFSSLTIHETINKTASGHTSEYIKNLNGMEGEAVTWLRPSGRVLVEKQYLDAYTRGEYIEKGDRIKIIDVKGASVVVKKISE